MGLVDLSNALLTFLLYYFFDSTKRKENVVGLVAKSGP